MAPPRAVAQVNTQLPPKLARALDRLCDLTGESRSTHVREALRRYLPVATRDALQPAVDPDKVQDAPYEELVG